MRPGKCENETQTCYSCSDGSTDFIREVTKDKHADNRPGECSGGQSSAVVVVADPGNSIGPFQHWTTGLSRHLESNLAKWGLRVLTSGAVEDGQTIGYPMGPDERTHQVQ